MRLRGDRLAVQLVAPELGWGAVTVALDQPVLVVGRLELEQRQAEFLDGLEGPNPEQVLLQRPDEALGPQPLPSGALTKAGDDAMPSQRISFWKSCDMYWLP